MNPNKFNGLYVKLNQDIISPNETVTGSIYLDLFHVSPGDGLCLKISGGEKVRWKDYETRTRRRADGTTETYQVEIIRSSSHQVIDTELDIHYWQKGVAIPRGQCVFPFAFQLPAKAPGSFLLSTPLAYGEISYSVEGFLRSSRAPLRHKLDVIVGENPKIVTDNKEVAIEKKLKTWCCINQGTVTMRTAFEKNAYTPGDEARIMTEIDNSKCALDHKYIMFTLWQTIILAAGPHRKQFIFRVCETKLGRIEAGENCVGEKRKEASMMLPPGRDMKPQDITDGFREQHNATDELTPSTHGLILRSDFHFEVTCRTDGCLCCTSAPQNTLPILILAKAPPHKPDLELPQNWQPQQMPNINLVVNLAPVNQTGTYDPQNQSMVPLNQPPQYQPTQPLPTQVQPQPQQGYPNNQSMVPGQMPYQPLNQQSPQYQPMQPLPTQMQPQQPYPNNQSMVPGQMPYQPLNQQSPQYQPMQPLPTQVQPQPQQGYPNQSPQQVQQMQPQQVQVGHNVNK